MAYCSDSTLNNVTKNIGMCVNMARERKILKLTQAHWRSEAANFQNFDYFFFFITYSVSYVKGKKVENLKCSNERTSLTRLVKTMILYCDLWFVTSNITLLKNVFSFTIPQPPEKLPKNCLHMFFEPVWAWFCLSSVVATIIKLNFFFVVQNRLWWNGISFI